MFEGTPHLHRYLVPYPRPRALMMVEYKDGNRAPMQSAQFETLLAVQGSFLHLNVGP